MTNHKNIASRTFCLYIIIGSIVFSTSCKKEDPSNPDFPSTASFLIGSQGSNELNQGLYKVTAGNDPVFITELFPVNYSSYYADINNGIIAFAVSGNLKGNTSGIAYMNTDNLQDIRFVPIPDAEEGYYYSVQSLTPRVLKVATFTEIIHSL